MLSKKTVLVLVLSVLVLSSMSSIIDTDSSAATVIVDDYQYEVTILTEPGATGYGTLRITGSTYAAGGDLEIPSEMTVADKKYLVTEIGDEAMRSKNMTSLVVPDTVKTIGANAFTNCVKLTKITLGKGLEILGENAFLHCYRVTEIHFNSTPELGANSLCLGASAKSAAQCDIYGFRPTRPVEENKNPYADVFGDYTTVSYKDITPDSRDSLIHIALIALGVFFLIFMGRSVKVKKIKRIKPKKNGKSKNRH